MAKTLKTTGIYANLKCAIGVDDDNTTVKDFMASSPRTVTLDTGVTVASGPYGMGVRVVTTGGTYSPRGINLSPVLNASNNTDTARTTIIIFNDYSVTNDGGHYYTKVDGASGYWIGGQGTDRDFPRLYWNDTVRHSSAKSIKNVRSMVALSRSFATGAMTQKFWVARDGESFPATPEFDGTATDTSLGLTSTSKLGGSSLGSQAADWFLYLDFDIALTHSQIETIYNSLTGSGACDCFVPPAAPVVTVDPTDQTVTAPAAATFSVTATGDGNSYQVQRSTNGGSSWSNVGSASSSNSYTTGATAVSGGSFNDGDLFRFVVSNAGGTDTSAGAELTVNAPADATPPTLTGSITVSALTTTSYTLSWPTGSDDTAVTAYEYSLNGGSTYTGNGTATTVNITGRTPGATDQVRVRARDAADNLSTPVLSTSVTLGNTTITLGPFASSGTVWPSGTAIHISWLPAGRIGSLGSVTAVDRTATLGAGGTVAVAGLPVGAGIAMVTKRNTSAADDEVCYQHGTVA